MRNLFYSVVIILFLCSAKSVSAQSNYISHTLQQGESLSALAAQYNTNVGDIMRMNGMHANSKLVYGSVIKIPAGKKTSLTTQTIKPVATEINKPVSNSITHKVVKGETLFSISKQFNISVNDLKTWNHLVNNSVQLGSVLIVGNNNAVTTAKPAEIKKQRVETIAPATTQPVNVPAQQTDVGKAEDTSVNIIANNTLNNNKEVANESNNTATNNIETLSITKNPQGYFADVFKKSRKEKHISGISKTFKTASGWSDGKYYILADDINPGTIVKLTADNGNAVYAKVLWSMGELKENSGINFRISNATAAALNENNDAFNLNVAY